MTQVYVIAASPHGPCKIGVAMDPYRRVADLQTGNYAALRVWARCRCPDAPQVESLAHSALVEHRLIGEWFAVPVMDAVAAIADSLAGRHTLVPVPQRSIGRRVTAGQRSVTSPHRKEYLKLKARERRARERAAKEATE